MNFALHFAWFAWQLFGPDPPIVVSKETTYLTAPLRADGLPDYERYILEKMREGVTPENNAAVLFLQAMGPGDMKPEEFGAVAREIGLDPNDIELPPIEDYESDENCKAVLRWLREQGRLPAETAPNPDEGDEWADSDEDLIAYDVFEFAMNQPWTTDEIPPLGFWVLRNRGQLDLLVAATQRQRFYSPSPNLLDNQADTLVVLALNEPVQATRDAARMLLISAMWHLGEGDPEKAWQDVLAVHRLARLIGTRNSTLIDALVAIAVDGIATSGTTALLSNPNLTVDLARQIQRDLNELAPAAEMFSAINDMERLYATELLLELRRQQFIGHTFEFFDLDARSLQLARYVSIDWNVLLADENRQFDALVAAQEIPSKSKRRRVIEELDKKSEEQNFTPGHFVAAVMNRPARSNLIGDLLSELTSKSFATTCAAEDRANDQLAMLKLAAALAVYRAENGKYPNSLDALVPQIIRELPTDAHNDLPFVYRRTSDGYLLYTCGENGKDDGGSHFLWDRYHGYAIESQTYDQVKALLRDEIHAASDNSDENDSLEQYIILRGADDIAIRVPLPKLELPKAK